MKTTGNAAKTTLGASNPMLEQTILEVEEQGAIEVDDGGGGCIQDGELLKIQEEQTIPPPSLPEASQVRPNNGIKGAVESQDDVICGGGDDVESRDDVISNKRTNSR